LKNAAISYLLNENNGAQSEQVELSGSGKTLREASQGLGIFIGSNIRYPDA
jgi:hypothetical protein